MLNAVLQEVEDAYKTYGSYGWYGSLWKMFHFIEFWERRGERASSSVLTILDAGLFDELETTSSGSATI